MENSDQKLPSGIGIHSRGERGTLFSGGLHLEAIENPCFTVCCGLYPVMLSVFSWICTQGPLLVYSVDHMGVPEIEAG